jgi:hypothetical protein
MEEVKNLEINKRAYSTGKIENFLDRLIRGKGSFVIRKGTEVNELIFDKKLTIFSCGRKNFPPDMIYMFKIVRDDVKRYLKDNPEVILPPLVDVGKYNYNYEHDNGTITGTDLNHAFWRIAYVKGYISEKTYERGLIEKAKALRLATLSTLGTERIYDIYENGVLVKQEIKRKKDEVLLDVYKDIRYSCYYMMYELSLKLGKDFDSYKTDCIYYRDTPENRALVHDYFNSKQMFYKQLV